MSEAPLTIGISGASMELRVVLACQQGEKALPVQVVPVSKAQARQRSGRAGAHRTALIFKLRLLNALTK